MKTKFYQRHEAYHKPIWVFITLVVLALIVWGVAGCSPKYGCPSTQGKAGYHKVR
jgi:hypothetical protein